MKAILLASLAELVLFACVCALLRLDVTRRRAKSMLIAFLAVLPMVLAVHFVTRPTSDFFPSG
jgi:hypothetical protein